MVNDGLESSVFVVEAPKVSVYRIVVAPDRSKLTGQYIDKLGSYDPSNPKNKLEIDLKLYQAWLKKGAQPTDTIKKLIDKNK